MGLTVTLYDSSGKKIIRRDPVTGDELPPIAMESQSTPYSKNVILKDGIRGASLTVTFFGIHGGDFVACHVEKDGKLLPGTRNVSPTVKPGGSMVTVDCNYIGE